MVCLMIGRACLRTTLILKGEIQELRGCVGEIALLKGESWAGNESSGASPPFSTGLKTNESRLLLSVDFISR